MTQAHIDLQSQMIHKTFQTSQTHEPHFCATLHLFSFSVLLNLRIINQNKWTLITSLLNFLILMKNLLNNLYQHLHHGKKYDIMKDHIFFTSPVYTPVISPKDSISTQRDDYLIPILSTETFTFKAQLTSLYMHPTDYNSKIYGKNHYGYK